MPIMSRKKNIEIIKENKFVSSILGISQGHKDRNDWVP